MKLLFPTQVLDRQNAVLGFVPSWIEAFAGECEAVRVVALEVGDTSGLPENVDWREVGRRGRVRRYLRWRAIMNEALFQDGFDVVLAHMVPRYALFSESQARKAGAGLFLWYTHKGVDGRLRRAEKIVDGIFTASEASLRIETAKRIVTGHGIDTEHFAARSHSPVQPPRVLSVGRLSRTKDPLTVLAATSILVSRGIDLRLDWVGGGLTAEDAGYARSVQEQIEVGGLEGRVELHGPVPWAEVPPIYRRASVLVNASLTGSVDKVVLEAMACERAVLTCNESFDDVFRELDSKDAERLRFQPGDANELAAKLEQLLAMTPADRAALGGRLRDVVCRSHEVGALCSRLVSEMRQRMPGQAGR